MYFILLGVRTRQKEARETRDTIRRKYSLYNTGMATKGPDCGANSKTPRQDRPGFPMDGTENAT
jgi:hypothetical protein